MQQLAVASKKSHSDVDDLALRLLIAIKKFDYKQIEKLVETGREKGLLNIKDKEDNTFIYLVAKLIETSHHREIKCPDIGDSSPLIQHVINVPNQIIGQLGTINKTPILFICICRFSVVLRTISSNINGGIEMKIPCLSWLLRVSSSTTDAIG